MSKKKKVVIITITSGIVLAALLIASLIFVKNDLYQYTYIEGTVTAYDPTPSTMDGDIIFSIDNTLINIGGGLDYGPYAEIDTVNVGDKVKAKIKPYDDGSGFTVVGCDACYIKKVES